MWTIPAPLRRLQVSQAQCAIQVFPRDLPDHTAVSSEAMTRSSSVVLCPAVGLFDEGETRSSPHVHEGADVGGQLSLAFPKRQVRRTERSVRREGRAPSRPATPVAQSRAGGSSGQIAAPP